jgi:ABC-type sugar transport system substrate-binding protein
MRRGLVPVALFAAFIAMPPPALADEIGAVLAGTRHFFWRTMAEGIKSAAQSLNHDVVIRGPVDGATIEQQRNIQ